MSNDLSIRGAVTETALSLPADLDPAAWRETGETLARMSRACQWWIGDWLNFGQDNGYITREQYDEAEALFPYSRKTLRNFAYVARQCSRRRDDLTWGHHEVVASLNAPNQERWLTAAEANGWSVGALRRQLRAPRSGQDEPERSPTEIDVKVSARDEKRVVYLIGTVSGLAGGLAEFRNQKSFPAAIREAVRESGPEQINEIRQEIKQARKNLLDLDRDLERALAEEGS